MKLWLKSFFVNMIFCECMFIMNLILFNILKYKSMNIKLDNDNGGSLEQFKEFHLLGGEVVFAPLGF